MAGNNSVHYRSGAWSSEDAQWLEDGKINSSSPLTAQHPFPLPHLSSSLGLLTLLPLIQDLLLSGSQLIKTCGLTEEITLSIKLEEYTFLVQDGTREVDRFLAVLKTWPVCGPLLKLPQL